MLFFLVELLLISLTNAAADAGSQIHMRAQRRSQQWDVSKYMEAFISDTGQCCCEVRACCCKNMKNSTSGCYKHKQVTVQLDHWTTGHTVTHSSRGVFPKILYFCGWHSLSLTLNSNNFHGIHLHYGFSVAFCILTIYCP